MAGTLTENFTINTLDYIAAYTAVSLGLCTFLSTFLFMAVLFLRGVLLKKTVFLKGMTWGVLLAAPFLGKLKLFYTMYEENLPAAGALYRYFYGLTDRWFVLCIECWWVRYGYLLGMVVCAGVFFSGRRSLNRFVRNMERAEVHGQTIWVNALTVTPFTAGLFSHRIVLPEILWKELLPEELELILCHEKTHIRSGHLWCYFLWDIVQILLWPNLLFALCRQSFQMDLEEICDKITIQNSGQDAFGYGMLLLKSMELLEPKAAAPKKQPAATAFIKERNNRNIRKRISWIAAFTPYRRKTVRILRAGGITILAGMLLLISRYSYPSHTEQKEIALFSWDQETRPVTLDKGEFEQAFSWDAEYVYIHRTAMDQILEKHGMDKERFGIGFGGYTKNARMGSSGNFVDVDYRGREEELRVPYWKSERNFWAAFLKMMP